MYNKMFEAFFKYNVDNNTDALMDRVKSGLNSVRINEEAFKKLLWENVQRMLADDLSDKYTLVRTGYAEEAYKIGFSDAFKFFYEGIGYAKK